MASPPGSLDFAGARPRRLSRRWFYSLARSSNPICCFARELDITDYPAERNTNQKSTGSFDLFRSLASGRRLDIVQDRRAVGLVSAGAGPVVVPSTGGQPASEQNEQEF